MAKITLILVKITLILIKIISILVKTSLISSSFDHIGVVLTKFRVIIIDARVV